MVANIHHLSNKAKAKVENDKYEPKEIEMKGNVQIEKKDDYLKLGSYLRECKLHNFPQKLMLLEDHVNWYYQKNESMLPMDLLDVVGHTPSL